MCQYAPVPEELREEEHFAFLDCDCIRIEFLGPYTEKFLSKQNITDARKRNSGKPTIGLWFEKFVPQKES